MEIDSSNFCLKQHYTDNDYRIKLITELDHIGWSTVEIRDFLNTNGIRPQRTDTFSTKLIWSTLKKLRDRQRRYEHFQRTISKCEVVISD